MNVQERQITSINVNGVAKAEFDTVGFSLTIEGDGKNGSAAKDATKPAISAVRKLLEELGSSGIDIDAKSVQSTLGVAPRMEYNSQTRQQKKKGYTATFTLSFQSSTVDRASEVHDQLTSIDGVQADSPDFRIKDLAGLHKLALADAYAKASERFANECAVFGLDTDGFEVLNWNAHYDDSQSAGAQPMRAVALAAASVESDPIEIDAGEATVQVRLAVTYGAKLATKTASTGRGASR